MTRAEAIEILKHHKPNDIDNAYEVGQALEMAMKALENIGHLTDRPCDVCEFHKENGCCKWTCVFSDGLSGGMA